MYREINLNECPDKTVKGVYISDETMVIVFTDETFTTFKAGREYDGHNEILQTKLKPLDFSHRKLVESGIMTQAEIDVLIEKRDVEQAQIDLTWKRAQLARLKKELGEV